MLTVGAAATGNSHKKAQKAQKGARSFVLFVLFCGYSHFVFFHGSIFVLTVSFEAGRFGGILR
jgi:hypothetical protein